MSSAGLRLSPLMAKRIQHGIGFGFAEDRLSLWRLELAWQIASSSIEPGGAEAFFTTFLCLYFSQLQRLRLSRIEGVRNNQCSHIIAVACRRYYSQQSPNS